MPRCGGLSEAEGADQETHDICDSVRGELEGRVGKPFQEYTAILVSKQLVAGTNFFVKIHIGGGDHVHARIFRPLPHENAAPSVHGHQTGKTVEDPIVHFD